MLCFRIKADLRRNKFYPSRVLPCNCNAFGSSQVGALPCQCTAGRMYFLGFCHCHGENRKSQLFPGPTETVFASSGIDFEYEAPTEYLKGLNQVRDLLYVPLRFFQAYVKDKLIHLLKRGY